MFFFLNLNPFLITFIAVFVIYPKIVSLSFINHSNSNYKEEVRKES